MGSHRLTRCLHQPTSLSTCQPSATPTPSRRRSTARRKRPDPGAPRRTNERAPERDRYGAGVFPHPSGSAGPELEPESVFPSERGPQRVNRNAEYHHGVISPPRHGDAEDGVNLEIRNPGTGALSEKPRRSPRRFTRGGSSRTAGFSLDARGARRTLRRRCPTSVSIARRPRPA
jgi:hypothetical protein